jgi:uncharacterized protein YceK
MMKNIALACLCMLTLSACGSTVESTQMASWDSMYYYDVDMPQQ